MILRFAGLVVALVGVTGPATAGEIEARYHYSDDTLLRIGPYSFSGGKALSLTVGIGSAAFRHPSDPPNILWTLGDRGPNIVCDEMIGDCRRRAARLRRGAQRPRLSDARLRAVDLPRDRAGG
jgi:hypothetical protein